MSQTCPTIKVKADNEQGFMVINESDFDEKAHEAFESENDAKKMTVAEIKEALIEKGIEIPDGAKKAELQALLDAAN